MAVLADSLAIIGAVLTAWMSTVLGRALSRWNRRRRWKRVTGTAPPERLSQGARREIRLPVWAAACFFAVAVLLLTCGTLASRSTYAMPWDLEFEHLRSLILYVGLSMSAGLVFMGWRFNPAAGRRRCPKCLYDCAGVPDYRCPECGFQAKTWRPFERDLRSWRWIIAGLTIVPMALLGTRITQAVRIGPAALVPSWVLVAGYEWLPESLIFSSGGTWGGQLEERISGHDEDLALSDAHERWFDRRAQRHLQHPTGLQAFTRAVHLTYDFEPTQETMEFIVRTLIRDADTFDGFYASTFDDVLGDQLVLENGVVRRDTVWETIEAHRAELDALMRHQDPNVRSLAMLLLAMHGDSACRSVGDFEVADREAPNGSFGFVMWTLAERCHQAVEILISRRDDPDSAVRARSLMPRNRAWLIREHPGVLNAMAPWLRDEDSSVRSAAKRAIYFCNHSTIPDPIRAIAISGDVGSEEALELICAWQFADQECLAFAMSHLEDPAKDQSAGVSYDYIIQCKAMSLPLIPRLEAVAADQSRRQKVREKAKRAADELRFVQQESGN